MSNPFPTITRLNASTLEINFGSVQNSPTPLRSYEGVTIYLKFRSVYFPLVLSGRSLVLTANLNFTGGEATVLGRFTIIGPLLRPMLVITKQVQVSVGFLDLPGNFFKEARRDAGVRDIRD
jgi:hypothetical protein